MKGEKCARGRTSIVGMIKIAQYESSWATSFERYGKVKSQSTWQHHRICVVDWTVNEKYLSSTRCVVEYLLSLKGHSNWAGSLGLADVAQIHRGLSEES